MCSATMQSQFYVMPLCSVSVLCSATIQPSVLCSATIQSQFCAVHLCSVSVPCRYEVCQCRAAMKCVSAVPLCSVSAVPL